MAMVTVGRRSVVRRVVAGVCAVGLLFGATACQSDEPLIHAQHDQGAKFGKKIKHVRSYDEIKEAEERLKKWGAEQSPDWLAVCNSINRRALRKLGFDPQNDLQYRSALPGREFQCVWVTDDPAQTVVISKGDSSMTIDKANSRDKFELEGKENIKGRDIYFGHIRFRQEQKSTCTTNFEANSAVYTVTYFNDVPEVNKHDACEVAIDLSSGN